MPLRGWPSSSGGCYHPSRAALNLEGPWPPGNLACAYRFATLQEALDACDAEPRCDGVTRDGGAMCIADRSTSATLWADGLRVPFPYMARSLPSKQWPPGSAIDTWLKNKGASCLRPERPAMDANPACPLRTADAAARLDVGARDGAAAELKIREQRDDHGANPEAFVQQAAREARSAAEAAVTDSSLEAEGACPSARGDFGGGAMGKALVTQCGGVASLLEQLSKVPLRNPATECKDAVESGCALSHNGRNDGWGGQHFRRVSYLISAVQFGCAYVHVPLFEMNANSRSHGINHRDGERFFGLDSWCADAVQPRKWRSPKMWCSPEPFGNAPVDEQPLAMTHTLSALCNSTALGMVRNWKHRYTGRINSCENAPRAAPLSRCLMLRAAAHIRRGYYAAHPGGVKLPWFTAAERKSGGGSSAMAVHVALHVRRGDLYEKGFPRWISNAKLNRAMMDLVGALNEVRSQWGRVTTQHLVVAIHVMTESDLSKTSKLPRAAWHALVAASNMTMKTHVDSDPFDTMHHLIHADVLIKSNSGFSDVASAYSAGVKLFFVPSRETFFSGVGPMEPLGLREPKLRGQFVCTLLAHLAYKRAHQQV